MKHIKLKPAFTMLELIFVIVILGIVASIGAELIAKVYEQYIIQRAQYRATMKTELAATQIANRLASAIPGTVYRIKGTVASHTYESINSSLTDATGKSYIGLQWVGADMDSFSVTDPATGRPSWSGVVDLNRSSTTEIITPGSNLGEISTVAVNLSPTGPIPTFHLYFPYDSKDYNVSINGQKITFHPEPTNIHMVEHYKLAWSSYALVVDGGDLYLYYSFTASPEASLPPIANRSLLMKNVSTFKFQGAGRTIRFKICKDENIGEDFNITSCKEKAVF